MYTLMHEIKAYFENKPEKTEEENILLSRIKSELKYAPIAFISRDDIEACRYDVSSITDDDLQLVASKMGNYYFKYGDFVGDLESAVENGLGLEKEDAQEE